MRKGLSEIVVMVLLLLIGASLVAVVYMWSVENVFEAYPEESVSLSYLRSRSCLSLENINGTMGTAYLRNCGLINLTNFTLYIDGSPQTAAMLPPYLEPNQGEAITFLAQAGEHGYIVVSDITETPYITR